MAQAIGIRVESELLENVERFGKEEGMDRSTAIRTFLALGYREAVKARAAEEYRKGKITLSEAARLAGLTVADMAHYLVDNGFVSSYSLDDLKEELKRL